jgi:hypothetical protein
LPPIICSSRLAKRASNAEKRCSSAPTRKARLRVSPLLIEAAQIDFDSMIDPYADAPHFEMWR